jgi:hypothetical protein
VAKKLSDIRKAIEKSNYKFYDYLMQTEDTKVMQSIIELSTKTRLFIFSGVIRNFFLEEKNNRDIDIVLEDEIDIVAVFGEDNIMRNSFGGFKITCNKTIIDMWYLKNTWSFKNENSSTLNLDLEHKVPGTAFFNFSSIVYSFNEKKFISTDEFAQFLLDEEIDVVNKKNPNYKLCVVNTFYYSDKYKLNIKENLKNYIVLLSSQHDHNYENVQLKHFGKIIFSNTQIQHRIETIFFSREKYKKRKIINNWVKRKYLEEE